MPSPVVFPSIDISRANIEIAFAVIAVVFILMTAVYFYHWTRYSFKSPIVFMAAVIYLGVSFLLLAGMAISLAVY